MEDRNTARRREDIDLLVQDMRLPRHRSSLPPPWWLHEYDALRGRTPTQALADGDEAQVRDLIEHWLRAADQSALHPDFRPRVRIDAPLARQIA